MSTVPTVDWLVAWAVAAQCCSSVRRPLASITHIAKPLLQLSEKRSSRRASGSGLPTSDGDASVERPWAGRPSGASFSTGVLPGRLTLRETEVLGLVRQGFTNDGIAQLLGVSERTIRRHTTRILEKLHASDRARAVARGFELGLLRVHADAAADRR